MTDSTESIQTRTNARQAEYAHQNAAHYDALFCALLVGQWVGAIVLAIYVSPYAWEGKEQSIHTHVWLALLLGGGLCSLPMALTLLRRGSVMTRQSIGVAMLTFSGLLIHLTGGHIETHFHIFGALAFLTVYRDAAVLLTASVVTALDHVVRGLYFPESIYGISNPEAWRSAEHILWVVFCDIFLLHVCFKSRQEIGQMARRQAEAEVMGEEQQAQLFDLRLQLQQAELKAASKGS